MEKTKLMWMDSIRGIGCIIVLIAHIISFHPIIGMYANGCGKIAVWLFFILSSFFSIYEFCSSEEQNIKIIQFYKKKLIRLYPIYCIGLIISVQFGLLSDVCSAFKHLFLMSGEGHFWYMTVLIKFLLLVPFVRFVYKKISNDGLFAIVMCIIAIIAIQIYPYSMYEENSINLKWYIPVLCMGLILAIIFKHSYKKIYINYMGDILVILSILIIVLMTPYVRFRIWEIQPSNFLQNKYLYIGGLWCIILFGIAHGNFFSKVFNKAKILQIIGKHSYGIYIYHYIFLYTFNKLGVSWNWNVILTLVCSFSITIILEIITDDLVKCVKNSYQKSRSVK